MVLTDTTKRPTLRRLADERETSVAIMLDTAIRENGSVRKAAASLGVRPTAIYAWMKRHNYRVERRLYRSAS